MDAETVQEQPRQAGEPTASFITAMATQNASESDKAGMAQVFNEEAEMGLELPASLHVDGAYISSEGLQNAHVEGRELHGPAPASPDRGKVFPVDSFDVHMQERYAICPAAERSSNWSRLENKQTGKVDCRIEWSNAVCGACALRDRCVSAGQSHRTMVVGELHAFLQARRLEMKTPAFKLDMHRRNAIEGTQSELIRGYGMRQARYRGKAKVRLQNYLIGAACNIRRLFRRLAWEALQDRGVARVGLSSVAA
jgi:hypothetical protein